MTTEADFLAAIHADADDVTVKLVFADWLEEREDPRALFLRDLVAWQQLPCDDAERLLNQRLRTGPLAALGALGEVGVAPRGLLTLALETCTAPAEAVPAALWVTQVDADGVAGLAALAWLRELFGDGPRVALALSSAELPSALPLLAARTGLDGVDALNLSGLGTDLPLLADLLARAAAPRLQTCRLTLDHATDDHLVALAALPEVGVITELTLDEGTVGDAGVEALSWGKLDRLEALSLSETRLGDDGAERLVQTRHFPRLRRLCASSPLLDRRGLRALLASALELDLEYPRLDLPTLADVLASGRTSLCGRYCCLNCRRPAGRFWLDLPGNALHLGALGVEGLQALGLAPDELVLEQLWLHTSWDGSYWDAVREQLPQCERVTTLGLIGTLLGEQAGRVGELFPAVTRLGLVQPDASSLSELVGSALWGRLTALGLRSVYGFAEVLTMLPPHCESLTLYEDDSFNDAAAALLAAAPPTGRLVELDVRRTRLTDAGAAALVRSPHLRNLRRLLVSRFDDGTGILDVTSLRERVPEVIVA